MVAVFVADSLMEDRAVHFSAFCLLDTAVTDAAVTDAAVSDAAVSDAAVDMRP